MRMFRNQSQRVFNICTIAYSIFSLIFLIGSWIDSELLKAFKIFPFLVLIYTLIGYIKNRNILRILVGVILGAIGDIILQYRSKDLFNLGAFSFLIGHVLYNYSIIQCWKMIDLEIFLKRKVWFFISCIVLFSLIGINQSTTLGPDQPLLSQILLPVYLVFLTLICTNSILLLCGSKNISKDQILLFFGTISFYISDNVLGKCVFGDLLILGDKRYNSLVIMITYYLGQYLIVYGLKSLSLKLTNHKKDDTQSLIQTE